MVSQTTNECSCCCRRRWELRKRIAKKEELRAHDERCSVPSMQLQVAEPAIDSAESSLPIYSRSYVCQAEEKKARSTSSNWRLFHIRPRPPHHPPLRIKPTLRFQRAHFPLFPLRLPPILPGAGLRCRRSLCTWTHLHTYSRGRHDVSGERVVVPQSQLQCQIWWDDEILDPPSHCWGAVTRRFLVGQPSVHLPTAGTRLQLCITWSFFLLFNLASLSPISSSLLASIVTHTPSSSNQNRCPLLQARNPPPNDPGPVYSLAAFNFHFPPPPCLSLSDPLSRRSNVNPDDGRWRLTKSTALRWAETRPGVSQAQATEHERTAGGLTLATRGEKKVHTHHPTHSFWCRTVPTTSHHSAPQVHHNPGAVAIRSNPTLAKKGKTRAACLERSPRNIQFAHLNSTSEPPPTRSTQLFPRFLFSPSTCRFLLRSTYQNSPKPLPNLAKLLRVCKYR